MTPGVAPRSSETPVRRNGGRVGVRQPSGSGVRLFGHFTKPGLAHSRPRFDASPGSQPRDATTDDPSPTATPTTTSDP